MRIDKDKCMKCLMCIDECQFNAIDVDMNNESKGYKGVVINEDICMECEACISVCPGDAIIKS